MKKILLFIIVLMLALTGYARLRYGGGEPYPDLSSAPLLDAAALETVVSYPEPIGNVAVSADGRIFFTVHPESRPQGNRLLEYVDGASIPYPNVESQLELFDTVLGLAIDRFNRLWTIDHGNHGLRQARIIAFDLDSGKVLRDQFLPEDVAPAGSFLQDLQVSADGETIVIADASFWRMRSALIVYDVATGAARRVLDADPSVSAENFVIRHDGRSMSFLGGIVSLRGGVDGIALGPEWLYYGALNGSGLYRVRLEDLRNTELPPRQLAARVERVSDKPLSDGFSLDNAGNVYITDVEHHAICRVTADGTLETLLQTDAIRWPDALSFGPDRWLYVADSALPELILKSREHIRAQAPYHVFRLKTDHPGTPGQ
ncbi:MAG: L-dopachrome tautomerase-related protein [Woeseiaceae bacterium]|nr:L-dopachrome tautomerase-related protein [Woeseiaceae bacterium]